MKRGTWGDADGTHYVGDLLATRGELVARYGEPDEGDGSKVTTEWVLLSDDGMVVTLYDWKRYEDGPPADDEAYRWHIGGHDERAVSLVGGTVDRWNQ